NDHLVPESVCIECKSDLLPKLASFGFCRDHGVAECVTHHPELAQTADQPKLPKYDTVSAVAMIDRPENNALDKLHSKRIQFTTTESVLKSGINVDIAVERPVTETLETNGELIFDPNRVAMLSAKTPGTVAAVVKNTGDSVKTGDVLALIDASQVGQLKTELLRNLVQVRSQKDNVSRLKAAAGAISQREILEAETALQEAEVALIAAKQYLANFGFVVPEFADSDDANKMAEQLRYLGIPADVVNLLPPASRSGNLIPVIAPFDGTVVTTDIVLGTFADTSKILFTVCDPAKMWIMLNVRQEDAKYIREGLTVNFVSDNGDQRISGKISWISPAIDSRTRTLQVRADVNNSDGKLRDKMFGTGHIVLREEPNAVVVPQEAVQATTDTQFVFIRDKNYFAPNSLKIFHVRQVRLGAKSGKNVEILAGVLPDEVVVTKGSNVLLAHLLRSNLGAGCCAEH
ncbi:MAG: efflux RND transporter periplasmic adaptor subunit, partial [Planctomycetaceae bacterium]|nr:efflux RND transporter periplasmic adaptor subunit [Planctomycetaceae bacterium]